MRRFWLHGSSTRNPIHASKPRSTRSRASRRVAPSLFYYEIRNALLVSERRNRITEAMSAAFLRDLGAVAHSIGACWGRREPYGSRPQAKAYRLRRRLSGTREARRVALGDARSRPRKGGGRRRRRSVRGLTRSRARADAEVVRFAAHPRGRASVEPCGPAIDSGRRRFDAIPRLDWGARDHRAPSPRRSISSAASSMSAQTADNPAIVDWALASVRGASVVAHGTEAPPANLDDPETVKAGARIYSTIGCVNCHGGPPDANWAKWSEGLKPVPADLKVMAKERTAVDNCSGRSRTASSSRPCRASAWRGRRTADVADRRLHQEIADRDGRRLQGLDGGALSRAGELLSIARGRRPTARAAIYCRKSEIRVSSLDEQSCPSAWPRSTAPIRRVLRREGGREIFFVENPV